MFRFPRESRGRNILNEAEEEKMLKALPLKIGGDEGVRPHGRSHDINSVLLPPDAFFVSVEGVH
jgi:hypothetical protein